MKVLVIPDVHLKPWMFRAADELMKENPVDEVVLLGDIVDDWDQEANVELYNITFYKLKMFINRHPNTRICWGNHDHSYRWRAFESGYSEFARMAVLQGLMDIESILPEGNCAYVHRIDNVVFSHAGLMKSFIEEHFDESNRDIDHMISVINEMGKEELWKDNSPIWARPQHNSAIPYDEIPGILQIVGHTPVKEPILKDGVLSVDLFSTYADGDFIGNRQFAIVDTETCEVAYSQASELLEEH